MGRIASSTVPHGPSRREGNDRSHPLAGGADGKAPRMARANDEVEALLHEYADLIRITGGDAFRARAYEKAARAIGGHHEDVSKLDAKALRDIPGVGRSVAEKVTAYLDTGVVPAVEELRARIPAGVREMTAIPMLGPRRAMMLYKELHIASVRELAVAIEQERLRDLPGFGPRTEENILHGIGLMQSSGGRVPLNVATEVADEVVAALSEVTGCRRCAYAGSLRRMRETIGDVDVLVAAGRSAPFMEAFTRLPYAAETIARGEKKASIRTAKGLQVDLRVVPPDSWGAAMQYFTGSKAHNIRTRELAVRHGLKLSEYGLFDAGTGELIVSRTEEEVYARLGLPGYRRPCARTAGRSRRGLRASCRSRSPPTTSAATCTPTPTSPTVLPAWRKWSRPPRAAATPTTPSPTTRPTCPCSG